MTGLPKRNEVPVEETWDLSGLFLNEAAYQAARTEWQENADALVSEFQGKIRGTKDIELLGNLAESLGEYRKLGSWLGAYTSLPVSVDITNPDVLKRAGDFEALANQLASKLTFIDQELQEVDTEVIESAHQAYPDSARFFEKELKDRPYRLDPAVEAALVKLSPIMNLPYTIYNRAKLSDLQFDDFEVEGTKYPNSFVLFESQYNAHPDKEIRRAGFKAFSENLSKVRATISTAYLTQVKTEKAMADLKGFDSVIDYLLHRQEVPRALYDRQIDGIMTHLAPVMQKYALLLKKVHGIDEMHYSDLKIALDPEMNPKVTIDEAWQYAKDGLAILGDEYAEMIDTAAKDRWVDFGRNVGKSTGGFCSSPYQAPSAILLNWNENLSEVFTLVHELGHAGHARFASQHQSIHNTRSSMYSIEAPSTGNELIFGQYMSKAFADEPRKRRWVIASLIANTYYHNFVTHLLEADYQRKVYEAIDRRETIEVDDLDRFFKETLTQFWGDAVILDEGAERTWMRQPHYYMGLYPYTYSAGLTIATAWVNRQDAAWDQKVSDWLSGLKAGGSVDVVAFAKLTGVDITTDEALRSAIDYVGDMVDQLWRLSEELGDI